MIQRQDTKLNIMLLEEAYNSCFDKYKSQLQNLEDRYLKLSKLPFEKQNKWTIETAFFYKN